MKVARLSALCTGRLYPPGNNPGTHFSYRLSLPQGHSAARMIMSMKNSNDTIGNRTRDLLACSAVPQPTVPPHAPEHKKKGWGESFPPLGPIAISHLCTLPTYSCNAHHLHSSFLSKYSRFDLCVNQERLSNVSSIGQQVSHIVVFIISMHAI